jgi:hypothetical protein
VVASAARGNAPRASTSCRRTSDKPGWSATSHY